MKIFRTIMVATVLLAKATAASTAMADHDAKYALISEHAEEIVCASRDLNDELRYRFHDSRLYGDLLATNARIRSKANYLRAQARPSRHAATCARYLADLDEQIHRMEALLNEARIRAARGRDPWLGNTRMANAYVAQMREAVHCLQRELSMWDIPRGAIPDDGLNPGYPREWRNDRESGYDRGFSGGSIHGSSTNSGSGIQVDRNGIGLRAGGLSVQFNR